MTQVGDELPSWTMAEVSAERMRTMAAILRDPNPLHWDRGAVAELPFGLGRRTINQGPLGLSYIVNMLHAWQGPLCLQRLVMRFPGLVLDRDRVTAGGRVEKIEADGVACCSVWLKRDEDLLLEGEAWVRLNG